MKRDEGVTMTSKRRTRAVIWGALLTLACLTAMPGTSAAFMIKWWQFPPMIGDPDYPTGGMVFYRLGSLEFTATRIGTTFVILVRPAMRASHLNQSRGR